MIEIMVAAVIVTLGGSFIILAIIAGKAFDKFLN